MATNAAFETAQSIPTHDELVARARAMVPVLKARAKQCVADRDVPAESFAEFHEAGFFRILQPKRVKHFILKQKLALAMRQQFNSEFLPGHQICRQSNLIRIPGSRLQLVRHAIGR